MARQGRPKEPLPPPLPPETRPVGQLIAEAIRLYGHRFWAALAIGIPIGVFGALTNNLHGRDYLLFALVPGAVLITLTYVAAAVIAADRPVPRRRRVGAVAPRRIGVPAGDEALDERDHFRNGFGGVHQGVGRIDSRATTL